MVKTLNFIIYNRNNNFPITVDKPLFSFYSNLSQAIFVWIYLVILEWFDRIIFEDGKCFSFAVYKTNIFRAPGLQFLPGKINSRDLYLAGILTRKFESNIPYLFLTDTIKDFSFSSKLFDSFILLKQRFLFLNNQKRAVTESFKPIINLS